MIFTIVYRILHRIQIKSLLLKVTAIIPEDLIEEVKKLSRGKNITESIKIALYEWVALKRIKQLNSEIKNRPLQFRENYSAESIRELNRQP